MPEEQPVCPTCGQPATRSLSAPTDGWECRNEACPEFGQPLDPQEDPAPEELRDTGAPGEPG